MFLHGSEEMEELVIAEAENRPVVFLKVFGETSAGQKQPGRLVEQDASEAERLQQIKYYSTLHGRGFVGTTCGLNVPSAV